MFIADSGASQFGEGEKFAGSATAAGDGSFVVALTGVAPGHILTATATDASGNTSEFSHNISVSGTITPPAAPSNLTATTVSANQIDLTWTDNSTNETGFILERSFNQSTWAVVASPSTNQTTFSDNTVRVNSTYFYRIKSTNPGGTSLPSNVASASKATDLPGRVQAEDYREGGEGFAYHDTTSGNQGGAYRNDGVDIQTTQDTTGTYNVGWVDAGEWLAYDVSFAAAGEYSVTLRVASPGNGRSLHIEIDDTNISGAVAVPNTGGYQSWQSITVGPFQIDAGDHTFEIVMDTNGFNINFFDVAVPVPDPWDVTFALPGHIEVENYRDGGSGTGFLDTTAGNQGGAYRQDAVDIQTTQDASGSYNVGWIDAGEWLAFDVSFDTSGTYTFTLRVATLQTGKSFHIELDDVNVTGSISVPNTGNWQAWTEVSSTPVSVSAGDYVLKVVAETNGYNINYLDVAATP